MPHDRAVLVDPHRHRDVDEPEQLVRDVARVDQARVRRRRGVDPLVRVLGLDVEGDRHHRQTRAVRARRAAPATRAGWCGSLNSWPRRRAAPCGRAATTEPERLALAVDQLGDRRPPRWSSACRSAVAGPTAVRRARRRGRCGMPRRWRRGDDIDRAVVTERAGRRHAHLAAAQTLRLRLPAGALRRTRRGSTRSSVVQDHG